MYSYQQFFNKRALTIYWVVQCILFIVMLGIAATGLEVIDEYSSYFSSTSALQDGGIILLCLAVVSLVFSIAEMGAFCAQKLHPVFYLLSNLLKNIIWLFYFVVVIYDFINSDDVEGLSIGLASGLWLNTSATLIWASVIVHKWRKERGYQSPFVPSEVTNVYVPPAAAPQDYNSLRADLTDESYDSRKNSTQGSDDLFSVPYIQPKTNREYAPYRGSSYEMV